MDICLLNNRKWQRTHSMNAVCVCGWGSGRDDDDEYGAGNGGMNVTNISMFLTLSICLRWNQQYSKWYNNQWYSNTHTHHPRGWSPINTFSEFLLSTLAFALFFAHLHVPILYWSRVHHEYACVLNTNKVSCTWCFHVCLCVCTTYICEYKLQLVHDKLNWIPTALIEYKTTASIQSMMIAQHKAHICMHVLSHNSFFLFVWLFLLYVGVFGVLTKMCIVYWCCRT